MPVNRSLMSVAYTIILMCTFVYIGLNMVPAILHSSYSSGVVWMGILLAGVIDARLSLHWSRDHAQQFNHWGFSVTIVITSMTLGMIVYDLHTGFPHALVSYGRALFVSTVVGGGLFSLIHLQTMATSTASRHS